MAEEDYTVKKYKRVLFYSVMLAMFLAYIVGRTYIQVNVMWNMTLRILYTAESFIGRKRMEVRRRSVFPDPMMYRREIPWYSGHSCHRIMMSM